MNNSTASTLANSDDWSVGGSDNLDNSNPLDNDSTKRELQRLRAQLRENPDVAAFVKLSRTRKRSWPDLLFALIALFGGEALVLDGAGQSLIVQAAGTIALIAGLSCVSSLTHESWHANLTTDKRINNFLSRWFLSPLLVADFEIQQKNHMMHHAYLGTAADPDGHLYKMSTKEFVLMLFSRATVIPYLLKIAGFRNEACTTAEPQRLFSAGGLIRIVMIQGLWLTAVMSSMWLTTRSLMTVAVATLFGYFLPIILSSFMIAIRGHREHYVDEATAKTVTCDTNCGFIERWLIAGGRFNWHVCHHLFPEIPQRLLPRFAKLIRQQNYLQSYYGAVGSLIAARITYFSSTPDRSAVMANSAKNSCPINDGKRLAGIELTSVPKCPICESEARDFVFTGREHEYDNTTTLPFTFYRCQGCSVVYPDPRPAESSLPIIYPPNYYSRAAGVNASPDTLNLKSFIGRTLHKMAVNRIAGNLAPYMKLGPEHTLIDIGCGSGRHLKSIQIATGCTAEGLDFEIRDELLERFSKPPLVLRRGDFLHYDFGQQKYDVVYAAHIIEHLADPIAFLRKIDSILKPGGVCVLETPNEDCLGARFFGADWGGNHIPRHWFLPNPRSAQIMVDRAAPDSLTLLKVKFIPITFVIWSLHSFLVTRGFKGLADALFPSDHRYMKTTLINVARHGVAQIVSRLEGLMTGKTACMVTVIRKRDGKNSP